MRVARVEEVGADGEVRIGYDSAVAVAESARADARPESAATAITNLALSNADLFHFGEDTFATIEVVGHSETYAIRSRGCRCWLGKIFFQAKGRAASGEALASATATLEGLARFEFGERETFIRVAGDPNHVWIDLCDAAWRQVEIDASGWRIVKPKDSPIRFRRTHGMLPLPIPEHGGSLRELRPFVNCGTDEDFSLLVAFCVGAANPAGPYPILILHGEQGTAKSTTTRVLRSLIDPNLGALRSEPREARDLMIAASNGWMIPFDNISRLEPWLSDCLCRLSTGGGFSTRTLYSDSEETIFQARRPTILNGIEELATRGDLLDRCIVLYLPRIVDGARRDERRFNCSFEAARPRLFGALLDAVSAAIRNHALVETKDLPRMADFSCWVVAAEATLGWERGTFIRAYRENRKVANELPLETTVAEAIRRMSLPYEGTATKLLEALNAAVDESARKSKGWPSSGRVLSNALRRLAPNLRAVGICVEFDRSGDKSRTRLITLSENKANSSSESSAQSGTVTEADAPDDMDDEKQLV
jgi:hypothetical protein